MYLLMIPELSQLSSGDPVTQEFSTHGYMTPRVALGMVSNPELSSDVWLPLQREGTFFFFLLNLFFIFLRL